MTVYVVEASGVGDARLSRQHGMLNRRASACSSSSRLDSAGRYAGAGRCIGAADRSAVRLLPVQARAGTGASRAHYTRAETALGAHRAPRRPHDQLAARPAPADSSPGASARRRALGPRRVVRATGRGGACCEGSRRAARPASKLNEQVEGGASNHAGGRHGEGASADLHSSGGARGSCGRPRRSIR
eukprot:scaffold17580_cov95-Phaeocystis_antarctica.AAC.5